MQKLLIRGGKKLIGTINISGSKNATLPILAATILSDKDIKLTNIPLVKDVFTMLDLLRTIGSIVKLDKKKRTIKIKNKLKLKTFAPYSLLKTMRAGLLVLGPMLAKYKKAKVSLPGGCAIGSRPVNMHLETLKKMGASVKIKSGYIIAKAPNGLKGTKIVFSKISVGATENIVIAACFAKGKTVIKNCACEPEIKDLIIFLKSMGCNIKWTGDRSVVINGVETVKSVSHNVIFDRIEAGTYMVAAALTKGSVLIKNINHKIIKNEIISLKKMGVKILTKKNHIKVFANKDIKKIKIETKPYPGFPTDLQAQFMVLMCVAKGTSTMRENIFENRFMHVSELNRMGANIEISGNVAKIEGNKKLNGAELMATDLRASVSLVLAALVASNRTTVNRIYHLDRGYEKLEKKLLQCGAQIKRLKY